MNLVLASASPRRKELLDRAGIATDVHPVDVDERPVGGESGRTYVARVSALKADVAASHFPGRPVLAADTTVVVGDEILGKPRDQTDAARMLAAVAGRSHVVLTGVAIRSPGGAVDLIEETTVFVAPMSKTDIEWYVATGEPMDKAGAYAIQGLASRFVTRVEGSYTNVVGLPVSTVYAALRGLGLA